MPGVHQETAATTISATWAMNMQIYEAMRKCKGLRLRMNIVETLFLGPFGDPLAWYYTDPTTGLVRVNRGSMGWEAAVALVTEAAQERGFAGTGPMAVERSRAVALVLQQDDLSALAQRLSVSNVLVNPPSETSPYSLQPYVAPHLGARFVAAYLRNDHGTACEAFPVPYSSRYLDITSERATVQTAPSVPAVSDAALLEVRHLVLTAVTFMRKAHGLALDGLVVEFVQDSQERLWFHTTIGVHVQGKQASWSCNYDAESKLVASLIEKVYAKQPAMRVFQRSSALPVDLPTPTPKERVKIRQQMESEINEMASRAQSTSPSVAMRLPPTPPSEPRGSSRGASTGRQSSQSVSSPDSYDTDFVGRLGRLGGTLDIGGPLDVARTSTPGRLNTLASLRYYQVETLKDALQEHFASATQAEFERLQEANRRYNMQFSTFPPFGGAYSLNSRHVALTQAAGGARVGSVARIVWRAAQASRFGDGASVEFHR